MYRSSSIHTLAASLALALAAPLSLAANPMVLFSTNQGDIEMELFADKAPKTVDNFIQYVKAGHYDGTIFHRVIPGFVAQGGGYTVDMKEKPTRAPIENEASNGLSNATGTLSMARTMDPHSASSQFYINLSDNTNLDHRDQSNGRAWGYAVFGKVTRGMEAVNKMTLIPTTMVNGMGDVPQQPIIVKTARLLPAAPVAAEKPAKPAKPTKPAAKPAKTPAGQS